MSTTATALLYFIGGFMTWCFLVIFGKKVGIGIYDPPHEDYYDDWDNNAQAYVWFSIAWPLFVSFHVIFWSFIMLQKVTQSAIDWFRN